MLKYSASENFFLEARALRCQKVGYNICNMRDALKKSLHQVLPILISAMAAGGITFLQSLAAQSGACPAPVIGVVETAAMGGGLKAMHSAGIFKSIFKA